MVALNFNATQVKPNVSPDPIPTGQYPVVITRSEEKPTKAGNGSYIELEMTVQGGEFNGRKVFDRLNIRNPNQQAVDIAYATLSAICHVTGRLNITATEQLHGVPFVAVVNKLPRNDDSHLPPDQQRMTNEVRGYKDINGNDPGFAGNVSNPGAQPNWAQGQQQGQQGGNNNQQQGNAQQQTQQMPSQNNGGNAGSAPAWANGGGNGNAPQTPQQNQNNGGPASNGGPPAWAQQQQQQA